MEYDCEGCGEHVSFDESKRTPAQAELRERIDRIIGAFAAKHARAVRNNEAFGSPIVEVPWFGEAIEGLLELVAGEREAFEQQARRDAQVIDDLVEALGPAGDDIYRDVLAELPEARP